MWTKLFVAFALVAAAAAQLAEKCQIDLALVVDNSGSICGNNKDRHDKYNEPCKDDNFNKVKTFLKRLISNFIKQEDNVRVSLITFNDTEKLDFNLNKRTTADMFKAIDAIGYPDGRTNLAGALKLMREQVFDSSGGDRAGVRNIAIVVTDGQPTMVNNSDKFPDGGDPMPEVRKNQNNGVRFLTVGVTNEVNKDLLEAMVADPLKHYLPVTDFTGLVKIIDTLVNQSCTLLVACQRDIVLLVDTSSSIAAADWNTMKGFLKTLVESLDVGGGRSRLGVIKFGGNVNIEFDLNDYSDKKTDIENAVGRIAFGGRSRNPTGAFRLMRTSMFTPGRGDRSDKDNLAILITYGDANVEANELLAEVMRNRNAGTRVLAVGVGGTIDQTAIKRLLFSGQNDYFHVDKFSGLTQITESLLNRGCRFGIDPTPPPPTTPPPGLCRTTTDVTFLLDSSGSITEADFALEKQFARALVADLNIPTTSRLGVVSYGGKVAPQQERGSFRLDKYMSTSSAQQAIDRITYMAGQGTNTGAAIDYMRQSIFGNSGDRSSAPNVAVLFTDGGSQKKKETIEAANKAKAAGIHIVSIGIGKRQWLDEWELRGIASWPYEWNYIQVSTFADLSSIQTRLRQRICNEINQCNSNPCQNGGTCQNGYGYYICRCPRGYAGIRCETVCRQASDVVIALDASGSIELPNFFTEVNFARTLVNSLNLNSDSRIGSLTFANVASINFYLNTYTSKSSAVNNGMNFLYSGGTTNTADAISKKKKVPTATLR